MYTLDNLLDTAYWYRYDTEEFAFVHLVQTD